MLKELVEKSRSFLFARKQDYETTFEGVHAQRVLRDLAKFCRAHETTFHADPRAHAVAEGRREVWLRIQRHLNLSQEQLWEIYGRTDLE